MNYLLGIIGLVIGLFLWSNIIGSLFASLPLQLKLKKVGVLNNIGWLLIILPILFSGVVIILFAIYSKPMLYGSLVAGVLILFNIGNLKREAYENFRKDKPKAFGITERTVELDGTIDAKLEDNILNVVNGTAPTKLKKPVIHKMIDQSHLNTEQKVLLLKKANELLKSYDSFKSLNDA